jgi:hypothetical protein
MTYREAWDRHIQPALDRKKEFDRDTGGPTTARQGTKSGAFEATRATETEANQFFDQLCGGRVYNGQKWWIDGTVPGIKTYDGKDK